MTYLIPCVNIHSVSLVLLAFLAIVADVYSSCGHRAQGATALRLRGGADAAAQMAEIRKLRAAQYEKVKEEVVAEKEESEFASTWVYVNGKVRCIEKCNSLPFKSLAVS